MLFITEMPTKFTSTCRTEIRQLAQVAKVVKHSVLEHLLLPKVTSRVVAAPASSTLAESDHSTADELIFRTQFHPGEVGFSSSREDVQKLWQDAQIGRTRSQMG